MDDFWGPFSFGLCWLLFALSVLWLLKRPRSHAVALHSKVARGLGWTLVVFALVTWAVGLPFSLGFCRGGFEDPLRCWAIPVAVVEPLSPLSLLLVLAGVVVVPVLLVGVLLAEALKRYSQR